MQKWITLPFGPRKKERRRERKKEGHNERSVGRPVGVGGYCYAPTMGTKGLARSLVLRRHLCPRDGRDADGHGRLLRGKLFGENPSSRRQSCSYPSSVASMPAMAKMAPRAPASKDEVTGPLTPLPLALDVGISRSAVARAVAGGRRPGHLQSHPLTP